MKRKKTDDDHGSEGADPKVDLAMDELGRILREIAVTAGETAEGESDTALPSDANTKGKRKSNQRRKKGGEHHD